MTTYEYKVVPAPTRGLKAKGVKTAEDRFANALETAMNDLAAEGWQYLRADTLPCEQREGLMGKTTVFQNLLVFRRAKEAAVDEPQIGAAPAIASSPPVSVTPEPEPETAGEMEGEPAVDNAGEDKEPPKVAVQ